MSEEPSSQENNQNSSQTDHFLRLHVANEKRIYAFILMMVSNWMDADDLMQETTSLMWHKFSEFKPNSNFVAWGIRIARYKILEFHRKNRNKRVEFGDMTLHTILDYAVEMSPEVNDYLEALQRCITELDERDRQLIRMRYEQNVTTKSLAKRLDRPLHGLYKVIGRIHNMLLICVQRKLTARETA